MSASPITVAFAALALSAGPALAIVGAPPPGVSAWTQNHNRAGPALAAVGAPPPGVSAWTQNHNRAGPLHRGTHGVTQATTVPVAAAQDATPRQATPQSDSATVGAPDSAAAAAASTPTQPPLTIPGAAPAPSSTWLTVAIATAAVVVLVLIAGFFVYRRNRAALAGPDEHAWPDPPLIVPPSLMSSARTDGTAGAPVPRHALRTPPPAADERQAPTPAPRAEPAASISNLMPPAPRTQAAARGTEPTRSVRAEQPFAEQAADDAGDAVEVGHVRFHRPPEGTLQLLPGRLEILSGTERVEEIRFVKVPGRAAVVTFGRNAGEPHTHVQLQAGTVSRMHAVMRFQQGRWHIANLSTTNPVTVGGQPLPVNGGSGVLLQDGDQVEMGEVIFRFRSR